MPVRTRFAPSPTGVLHIGSIRTALFCWLHARHNGGEFILRIEDTDRERSTKENVDAILDGMAWVGLDCDQGPYYQTARFDRYREVTEKLLADGHAYHCYCSKKRLSDIRERQIAAGETARYDGLCRSGQNIVDGVSPVVRFKNPKSGEIVVNDLVRGEVVFDNAALDDLIIARSDGTPTYNFTVVVDDHDMGISHVIRGDDHLNNTPRQINIFNALGVSPPTFAHLPMILGPDLAKLSKRHGAVDIREYRDRGFLPQALLNYLVRLGWSHGDQEIFSLAEMIKLFDIEDVNQSASAFNPEKLLWLNQQYIIATPADQLAEYLLPFLESAGLDISNGPPPREVAAALCERAETLQQMAEKARFCYEDFTEFDAKAAKKHLRPVVLDAMTSARDGLADLEQWTTEGITTIIEKSAAAHELNMGKLGQPIRVAVTGNSVSPPIDTTVWLVGKDRTLLRLNKAIEFIEARQLASSG